MKKIIGLAVVLILIVAAIQLNATSVKGGLSKCSANSTLGGSCETNCQSPLVAKCSGDLISADCQCVTGSTEIIRVKPSLSQQNLTDANDLKTYCTNYGTGTMSGLVPKITDVMTAFASGTDAQYTADEASYTTYCLSQLSTSEKSDINNWVKGRGYLGF